MVKTSPDSFSHNLQPLFRKVPAKCGTAALGCSGTGSKPV